MLQLHNRGIVHVQCLLPYGVLGVGVQEDKMLRSLWKQNQQINATKERSPEQLLRDHAQQLLAKLEEIRDHGLSLQVCSTVFSLRLPHYSTSCSDGSE
jgi:hypothetical protein